MMNYTTVQKKALQWEISERAVRKLCIKGKINGAVLQDSHWMIPVNASRPEPEKAERKPAETLLPPSKLLLKHVLHFPMCFSDQRRFIRQTGK